MRFLHVWPRTCVRACVRARACVLDKYLDITIHLKDFYLLIVICYSTVQLWLICFWYMCMKMVIWCPSETMYTTGHRALLIFPLAAMLAFCQIIRKLDLRKF